jgi:hypothetical protein
VKEGLVVWLHFVLTSSVVVLFKNNIISRYAYSLFILHFPITVFEAFGAEGHDSYI